MPVTEKGSDLTPQPELSFEGLSTELLQQLPDGAVALDSTLRVVFWNKAMEELTGYRPDEVLGKDINLIFPFSDHWASRKAFESALAGTPILKKEHRFLIPEKGKTGWANLAYYPLRNTSGHITGLVGLIREITRQKETERQLAQTQELYQLLANTASDIITRHSPNGYFTYASPVCLKVIGYSPEQLVGRQAFSFIHPEDQALVRKAHKELQHSEANQVYTYRFRHRNGTYRWLESTTSRVADPETGQLLEVQVSSRDVTEKKETEDHLKSKNKLLNGLLSNLPVLVRRISADGSPLLMQGKALRKIGLDQNRWQNWHLRQEEESVIAQVLRAMNGDSVSIIEKHEYQDKPVFFQSFYFPDLENPGGAIGFSIDITEQKLAEDKLVRNQLFIRKITDSTPFLITIFDFTKGYFIYSNQQVPEVLGYTMEEVEQMGPDLFMTLVHPDDLLQLAEYIHRVTNARDGEILSIEVRVRDKKGQWRWFLSRSSIFSRDERGMATKGLSVTQDIDQAKKSKNLLSGVLDSSPNGIMAMQAVRDDKGQISDFEWVLVNATAERLLGRTAQELVGKQFAREMPEEAALMLPRYTEVVSTGQPLSIDQYFHNEGAPYWLYISAVKMGDGITVTLNDITEAKEAREKIRKSEALLSEAQKIAHLGIWEWNLETDILSWSDELYRIFGYETEQVEITFAHFETLVHLHDLDEVRQGLANSVEQLVPFERQFRIVSQSGEEKIVSSRAEVQTSEEGKPIRMLGTLIDITELITIKQELENIKQLRHIGEAIPQIVWTARPDGSNDYLNKRWHEYTGLEEVPDAVWDWSRVIHPDDLDATMQKWKHALETGKVLVVEFRVRRADGAYRWHLVRMVPMHENGHVIKWFGTATDIQHQKQIQQELEQAQHILSDYNQVLNQKNAQLQKINADLDNFIYTASHDLKAPIHNIEGLVEVLSGEINPHTPTISEVLGLIYRSIGRFKATVQDLTEISKVERAMVEEATLVDLANVVAEIGSDIQPLIKESAALIETDLEVPQVLFSRKNMRSVLYNLISNGIKYRSPGRQPQVLVRSQLLPDGCVLLAVHDNGLGLEQQNLGKVFEMFRRVHTHVEGTGIGLYIVKRIIENAGGRIEVESELDKGTTFSIYLPPAAMPKPGEPEGKGA